MISIGSDLLMKTRKKGTREKIIDIATNESETYKAIPLKIIQNSCAPYTKYTHLKQGDYGIKMRSLVDWLAYLLFCEITHIMFFEKIIDSYHKEILLILKNDFNYITAHNWKNLKSFNWRWIKQLRNEKKKQTQYLFALYSFVTCFLDTQ